MSRLRRVFMAVSVGMVLLVAGVLLADRETKEDLYEALGNLAEVVHLVETEYVDELNQEALSLSLDAGIVESVDQWGAVLPPEQVDSYMRLMESAPAYGLCVSSRLGSAAVRHTLAGSPAAASGLEPWELIEEVEGVNTRGRPLWQIRIELDEHFRGGRPVELTVVDREVDVRRKVVLEATPWTPEPVAVQEREGAQVIKVESLPGGAAAELAKLVPADGPLVLDLRKLGWGLEDEALAAADLFVDKGELGRWKGQRVGEKPFEASPGVVASALPIVLIGPDTEGVGETLAAALQGAGATVVGAVSAGHAPHMQLVNAGDVSLWIPVALWLRADGEPITGHGVEPAEVVEAGDETGEADPVLERALELLDPALDRAA